MFYYSALIESQTYSTSSAKGESVSQNVIKDWSKNTEDYSLSESVVQLDKDRKGDLEIYKLPKTVTDTRTFHHCPSGCKVRNIHPEEIYRHIRYKHESNDQ